MARKHKRTKIQSPGATRALQVLQAAGVPHEVIEYEHSDQMDHGYAMDTSEVLGIDPALIFKTLLAEVDHTPVVGVVPATRRLNLKALARAAGGKHSRMMEPVDAERITGYVTGGISPVGQTRRHRTFIDSTARDLSTILVSGGKRSLSVSIAPADLAELVGATFAPISQTT